RFQANALSCRFASATGTSIPIRSLTGAADGGCWCLSGRRRPATGAAPRIGEPLFRAGLPVRHLRSETIIHVLDPRHPGSQERSGAAAGARPSTLEAPADRKSTRLNSSHVKISYAVF